MLSSGARAAARLELDALVASIRVSFDDRVFVACLVLVELPCSICWHCSHDQIALPGRYIVYSVHRGLNSLCLLYTSDAADE